MKKLLNKDFFNNFIGLSSMNLMALLVPLVTMPILSKSLGIDTYGIFLLLLTINGFGQSFVSYSFGIIAVRELSAKKNIANEQNKIFSEIFSSQCLLAILYMSIILFISSFDVFYLSVQDVFFYSTPVVASHIFFSIWFHQAVSEVKFVAFLNISARIIFVIYCVFFVVSKDDLSNLMFIYAYSLFLASLISFVYRIKKYNIKMKFYSPLKRINQGRNAFLGLFSPNLYSNVPGLALPSLVTESQYTIFSVAIRIINVANMAQNIISRSLFPVLAGNNDYRLRDILKINLTVSIFISFCFILLSDFVISILVGAGYETSVFYIKISTIGIIALSITDSIANGFYLIKNKDRDFRNISIKVSVICSLVSIPLVFYYHSFGAIIVLIFARVMFAIFYCVDYYWKLHKKNEFLL